jgi:hypothetical protein
MKFELVLEKTIKFWNKEKFEFTEFDDGLDNIFLLKEYYIQIENQNTAELEDWWISAMNFTLYQVYTAWGLMMFNLGLKEFEILKVPEWIIKLKFKQNLEGTVYEKDFVD